MQIGHTPSEAERAGALRGAASSFTLVRRALLIGSWSAFIAFGIVLSLGNGLSWDEWQEALTLRMNSRAVAGLLASNPEPYERLEEYQDRYYGIGFHLLALPMQKLLAPFYRSIARVDSYGAFLLAKHMAVFALFALSCLAFFALAGLLIDDAHVRHLATLLYATCPYLLGHGTMNVKDAPFMVAWLLCTAVSSSLMVRVIRSRTVPLGSLLLLVAAFAWLVSIRIIGVLLLIQLGTGLVTSLFLVGTSRRQLLRRIIPAALAFLFMTALLALMTYPIFWKDPSRVSDAIRYMATHFNPANTRVFGILMPAQDLPPTYIPLWAAAKLPVVVLIGLLVMPIALVRMSGDRGRFAVLLALSATVVLIPLVLVIGNAVLYDELRQLLFLFPLAFLAGLTSIHRLLPRTAIVLSWATLALFIIDNVRLYPYQYTWLNEVVRFAQIDERFETDYWGTSGRALARSINERSSSQATEQAAPLRLVLDRVVDRDQAILAPRHLVVPFFDAAATDRLARGDEEPLPPATRPYFGISFGVPVHMPADCREMSRVTRKLSFATSSITMGVSYECR
ncbi:MAG TPA: hypothetical protein VMT00_15540 [Thermoanaerobaculia bacterium]|nr:hypothetical protein [Thermoanaerobaculia bacterium]